MRAFSIIIVVDTKQKTCKCSLEEGGVLIISTPDEETSRKMSRSIYRLAREAVSWGDDEKVSAEKVKEANKALDKGK